MELLGESQLRKDARKHGDAQGGLEAWMRVVAEAKWRDITEVRQTYRRSVDYVKGRTVFNIKGNSYRLIVVIDYALQLVADEAFLTHAAYDKYKF